MLKAEATETEPPAHLRVRKKNKCGKLLLRTVMEKRKRASEREKRERERERERER